MTRKFIVYAPSYDEKSGGAIALHKLCHVLNQIGEQAFLYPLIPSFELNFSNIEEVGLFIRNMYDIANPATYRINPELPSPVIAAHPRFKAGDDFVVVYPEIVFGNPLGARNVVRWFLHNPGFHSGKVFYGPGELYFRFGSYFGDFKYPGSTTAAPFLRITHTPFELYHLRPEDDRKPRSGVAYCLRKGRHRPIAPELREAILIDDKTHAEVAQIFKSAKTFVSYDTHTLYSRLAAIAGCDSIVVPLEGVGKDEWLPDPADRFGIAYGFDDLDYARRTRGQLVEAMRADETRTLDAARDFVREVQAFYGGDNAANPRSAPTTAVVLHLHYPDLWPEFATALGGLPSAADLYVSLTKQAVPVRDAILAQFPGATIVEVDNRGRDIAPRLALMRRVVQADPAYSQVLMVHGKKSPHLRELKGRIAIPCIAHGDGDRWRHDLLHELFGHASEIIASFARDPQLGLVGPHGFVLRNDDANYPRVDALRQRMGRVADVNDHLYFAGSMFWCRPQALAPLLGLNLDAEFEAEAGQTDGTLAHAVERLFVASTLKAGLDVADSAGAIIARAPRPGRPWLPSERWLAHDQEWAREALATQAEAGSCRIAIGILANAAADAASTRHSIESQWLGATVLALAATGDTLLVDANTALREVQSDWVGVIDAGDRLAADALFRAAGAITRHPQWQLVYTDEDTLTPDGQHVNPHCKPDFNLDYLRSLPYIGGLMLIRRDLFEALGGFDPAFEGAEDYDLLLRAWEHLQTTGAGEKAIGHVAEVLYHRAQGSGHTRKSVPEILASGQAALQAHFQRLGIAADVQPGPFPPSYRTRWPLPDEKPLVSILVPTRNQLGFLQRCVESVIEKTKYPSYEIIVIDNDSDDADTCRYLDAIETKETELAGRLRVLRQPGPFNFSAMNNAAARTARGDYLLLLNNDTAALHDDWLDEMMSHAVRPDVGIVGAKLLFPDGKIQHAGVILGMRGPAEHPFINRPPEDRGYFGRAQLVQNLSAVTGACLLVRKSVFDQVGGLDETDFKVSYNDIDLCLKVRESGLRIVFTPFALLLHEGSASQKGKVETAPDQAKLKRFAAEKDAMYRKWLPALAFDPAYNRHLSLASTDFLLDDQPCLSWDPEWRPRPRILVHPADREGCGEYRIIAPMRALNRAGLTQGWETMRLFEPPEMQRMDPDVLVVQRQMEWPQIEAIERHARTTRAFRVFEIDDLITNLPVRSVHKSHIHKDIAKRFRKAAGLCNRLVVATEPLARAYAGFADEVVVCPNHIEAARWGHLQPARAERAKPRVGWAGGIGHTGDLELIADVVRETAAEVDWVFFGMCPEALKPLVKEFHAGVPLDQYPAKLASLDLDLAVAPLEDNAFNEAKSHLRLLEYGILGYPVICSDLTPYQGDFPVLRVANRFRDWMRAIREAVSDRDALRMQGDALRAKVRADWILEDHLDRWIGAWTP